MLGIFKFIKCRLYNHVRIFGDSKFLLALICSYEIMGACSKIKKHNIKRKDLHGEIKALNYFTYLSRLIGPCKQLYV